jgi:hypothetical protein
MDRPKPKGLEGMQNDAVNVYLDSTHLYRTEKNNSRPRPIIIRAYQHFIAGSKET